MSRHFFKCELRCEVRVELGYDDAAQGYVLEVRRVGANLAQGHSPCLYASADDPNHTGDDLDYCRDKIEKLGLVVPESMYRAVEEDAAHSNRSVEHYSDARDFPRPRAPREVITHQGTRFRYRSMAFCLSGVAAPGRPSARDYDRLDRVME